MPASTSALSSDMRLYPDLIQRYDLAGPRYTSYPTSPQFNTDFNEEDIKAAVERSNNSQRPLSLYFHIPFCETLCFYCGCNKIVTNNKSRAAVYLESMEKEVAHVAALFDTSREVTQLHWGGGTPTYISDDQMTWLMNLARRHFTMASDDSGEYSIEVHPGRVSVETMGHLRNLGFNRVSMGIQDFDPKVQAAVNRYNSVSEVSTLVSALRQQEYKSISMDLIYGLPHQASASFADTLRHVIDLSPDRLSLFNYAHLPHLFKSQSLINEADLPPPAEKLNIFYKSIELLDEAGYVYIGMDHFAKPDDSLVKAQRAGQLQRNFQGYSTHGDCDLLAFGVSSISSFGGAYLQNAKQLNEYMALANEVMPAWVRGVRLSNEDHLRRYVINQLICHFQLAFDDLRNLFNIEPAQYFAEELASLQPMVEDGLLLLNEDGMQVTSIGRLLIRRICMVFDEYLNKGNTIRFSKVI